jgi:hypothetical protein
LWCRHAAKKSPALVGRAFLKGHADECEREPKIVAYEGGALLGDSADQLRECLDFGH